MTGIMHYEFIKIIKKRIFLIITALLLAGNLLTLFLYEKNTAVYHYVYEHKEEYQDFLSGKKNSDLDGFYQQEKDSQENYLKSYRTFLDEMAERAADMESVSIFSDEDSYVYRNLEKTVQDFSVLSGLSVQMDNCFGVRELAGYDYGILFLIIFLAMLSYFLFYYERNQGILLLLKGTKRGHTSLALGKLGMMAIFSAFYTLLQESSVILLLGHLYGYGTLERSIQSVSEFRNCPYPLTVGGAILLMLLIRVLIAELLGAALYLLSICIRNEFTTIVTAGLILGAEFWAGTVFSISGSFNELKCINPFFCWNLTQSLGTYLNLNLFGYAVGKNDCTLIVNAAIVSGCAVGGILFFNHSCQVRSASRLEKLFILLRKKSGFLWRHTNLLRFEFSKVLIQQKKGIILALLLIWSISEMTALNDRQYYATAGIAAYHSYLSQLDGKVTDESIAFVHDEEAYIQELSEKLTALGENPTGKDYLVQLDLQTELESKEDAIRMLFSQLEALQDKPGDIHDKYWVDEVGYLELFDDSKTDITLWLAGAVALLLWISGVYPIDEKKKLFPLLRATKNGRIYLNRRKDICCWIGTLSIFLLTELPMLLQYYRIDGFSTAAQKMCDLTQLAITANLSLGTFLLILFLLKAFVLGVLTIGVMMISRLTRSEMITNIIGIGIVGMVAVLLYYFKLDLSILLLQMMS